jgi:hypothetical protein
LGYRSAQQAASQLSSGRTVWLLTREKKIVSPPCKRMVYTLIPQEEEKMKTRARVASILFFSMNAFGVFTGTASAQSDFPFKLHNRSQGWTINSFQTFQDGQWSSNWLNERVKSGEVVNMDWKSNAGNCVVRFRVGWVDYDAQEFRADFCTLKNLYMLNEGFRTD